MRISPGQAAEKIPFHIHGLGWSSQSSLLDSALSQSEHLRQWLHSNDRLRRRLELKAKAQYACAQAEIDVKLRRAMLRRFTGNDEDLQPGERCLYWRETGNRFHTNQWKGPAVVVAVQTDPDTGCIDTYRLAHGTMLSEQADSMFADL